MMTMNPALIRMSKGLVSSIRLRDADVVAPAVTLRVVRRDGRELLFRDGRRERSGGNVAAVMAVWRQFPVAGKIFGIDRRSGCGATSPAPLRGQCADRHGHSAGHNSSRSDHSPQFLANHTSSYFLLASDLFFVSVLGAVRTIDV
jgi:hypothetical protein